MKIAIHQPNFFPWKGYYKKIIESDLFIILDDIQFSKQSYTQRTQIKTNNDKTMWMSIPVMKEDRKKEIREIRINNKLNWKAKHMQSLKESYKNSEFFNEYMGKLETIYKKKWENLLDFNIATIGECLHYMGLKWKYKMSSELNIKEKREERIIEICRKTNAKIYLSGKGGMKYTNRATFHEKGIEMEYIQHKKKPYKQIGRTFIDQLSILDILFNLGGEKSREYLLES